LRIGIYSPYASAGFAAREAERYVRAVLAWRRRKHGSGKAGAFTQTVAVPADRSLPTMISPWRGVRNLQMHKVSFAYFA
jgi:hypothetical protein